MDNIPVNNENVEVLLQRFFDGETSCAEERALETYFCSGATLPPEVECYRDMFGWYASGMDESRLPQAAAPRRRSTPRILVWWGAVAASIALVIGLGWNHRVDVVSGSGLYSGSYVVRDGIMVTGDEEIKLEVEATLDAGTILDSEIDARIAMLGNEQ